MSRMIVFLSVVIVLFAVAAGGSWYLQMQQGKDGETPHTAEEKSSKPGAHSGPQRQERGETAPIKPLIRPSTSAEMDRLTQMAASLQQQQEAIKVREQQIATREKQMDMCHEEIKREQKKLDAARRDIQNELLLVQEKLELLEKRSVEGEKDRKAVDAKKQELQRTIVEVESQEWNNLKQQIKTIEKMDPEAASLVVVQMVDQGKLETAVKIMSQMRDRQAAAIFAEIAKQDAKLPGQLFERMLVLKTPTVSAPK